MECNGIPHFTFLKKVNNQKDFIEQIIEREDTILKKLNFDESFLKEIGQIRKDVTSCSTIIPYVPVPFRMTSVYLLAVYHNGNAINCIPTNTEYFDIMCYIAIKQNRNAAYFIEKSILEKMVDCDDSFLDFIRYDCRTIKMLNTLIRKKLNIPL